MKNIFKPILYQTEMVQAVLEGRKNQTRRTKGLEEINNNPDKWKMLHSRYNSKIPYSGCVSRIGKDLFVSFQSENEVLEVKAPYQVGNILWVRESFYTTSNWDHWKSSALEKIGVEVYYKADIWNFKIPRPVYRGKIRPSIFLPKAYSRIFLKIRSIKVERVQEISPEDSISEGIKIDNQFNMYNCYLCYSKGHVGNGTSCNNGFFTDPIAAFFSLWIMVNGRESFIKNPWVWVIEFERIEKPLDFIV